MKIKTVQFAITITIFVLNVIITFTPMQVDHAALVLKIAKSVYRAHSINRHKNLNVIIAAMDSM